MSISNKLREAITKIDADPQYLDFFYEKMSQNWGNDAYQSLLDELIAYYKEKEEIQSFSKLALIKMENYVMHGELVQAKQYGEILIKDLSTYQQTEALIQCYDWVIMANTYRGNWMEAISLVNDALLIAEQGAFQELHSKLLLRSVTLYMFLQENERAEEILESISHMSFLFNDEIKMRMALNRTYLLWEQNQLEEANKQVLEACKYAEKLMDATGNSFPLSIGLVLKGLVFTKRQLVSQGEKDFNDAIKLADERGYKIPKLLALICFGTGSTYGQQHLAAVDYFKRALSVAEEIKSDYFCAMAHRMLSMAYEQMAQYEKALEELKYSDLYCYEALRDKVRLQMDQLEAKHINKQLERFKCKYSQMEHVAKMGACFTSELSKEHLEKAVYSEVCKLLHFDLLGTAYVQEGKIEYNVFDKKGHRMAMTNDIVRYTQRLAECSIEFQKDILINDGNFEAYSMKVIKESQSNAKLQSMIVKPLIIGENVLGAVTIGSYQPNKYSLSDLNLVDIFAAYMAITLKNALLYQEVRYLAEHDALTGILRRGIVLNNGEKIFKENRKHGRSTAVIMFDTDNFKQLNDKYGHQLGDQVLKKIGKIMKKNIPSGSYAGRYGGEEFIAILDGVTDQQVSKIAEKIKLELESSRFETKKEKDIKVTLSGGIYVCNEFTLNFADAIRFADHALYRAKILGRNRIIRYNFSRE